MTSSIDFDIKSQLIQDYFYTNDPPPLALGTSGSLVAIGGGFAAIDGSQLVFFERSTRSQSGWKSHRIAVERPQTATGAEIVMIKGFEIIRGSERTLNILCSFPAASGSFAIAWLVRPGMGGWEKAKLTRAAAGLLSQVTSVDSFDAGEGLGWFVYGVAAGIPNKVQNNSIVFALYMPNYNQLYTRAWEAGSQIDVSKFGYKPEDQPRFSLLGAGARSGPRSVVMARWNIPDARLQWAPCDFSSTGFAVWVAGANFESYQLSDRIESLKPINTEMDRRGPFPALLLTAAGKLMQVRLPGNGNYIDPRNLASDIESISPTTLADGTFSIFAISSATGTLHLLRKIESKDNEKKWVDLGNTVKAIAAPLTELTASSRETLEVFYAERLGGGTEADGGPLTYDMYHMSMNGSKVLWTVHKVGDIEENTKGIEDGTVAPKDVSAVAIDLHFKDETGGSIADVEVFVETDQWTNMIIDDLSYWVGPGHGASFHTDSNGQASIRHEANTLKFPKLHFRAWPRKIATTRWCQGDMIEVVASESYGTPQTIVAAKLADRDPSFKLDAKLRGSTILPPKSTDKEIGDLKGLLFKIGDFMESKRSGKALEMEPATWRLTRTDGGFTCVELPTALPRPEGIFSDVWGDVTHFAKHALNRIEDWTITVASDALAITVVLADQKLDILAKTIEAAGDLVETIFCAISSGIKKMVGFIKEVVAFLRMLMDWEDFIRTHLAVRHMVEWNLTYAKTEVEQLRTFVDKHVKTLEDNAKSSIEQVKEKLEGGSKSANDFISANNGNRGNAAAMSAPYRDHLHHHGSRCNYVYHRSKSRIKINKGLEASSTGDIKSLFDKHWNNAEGKRKSEAFSGNFTGTHPAFDLKNVFGLALSELLTVAEDVILFSLNGIKDIADFLLGRVVDLIEGFYAVLTDELHIPVITYLYKTIAKEPLTILNVLALIVAVPITVVYKVIEDKAPFGDADVALFRSVFVMDEKRSSASIDFAKLSAPHAEQLGMTVLEFVERLMMYCAGLATMIGTLPALLADNATLDDAFAGTDTPMPLSGWLSIIATVVAAGLSTPIANFFAWHDDPSSATAGSVTQVLTWAIPFVPWSVDVLFILATLRLLRAQKVDNPDTGTSINWGALVEFICGALAFIDGIVCLITGLAEHLKTAHPLDYTNALVSSFPRLTRVFIYGAYPANSEGASVFKGLVFGGDAVGGLTSGVLSVVEALIPSLAQPGDGTGSDEGLVPVT